MADIKKLKETLKRSIDDAVEDGNVASAVNVGGTDSTTSVSSKQEITTKDGVTTKREIREERRS